MEQRGHATAAGISNRPLHARTVRPPRDFVDHTVKVYDKHGALIQTISPGELTARRAAAPPVHAYRRHRHVDREPVLTSWEREER